ncbi:MAG TPA: hypothetical protein VFJ47_16915 [Terriglobales bacterium]|nr:hypothetical protein [Terriglobales bacterium]
MTTESRDGGSFLFSAEFSKIQIVCLITIALSGASYAQQTRDATNQRTPPSVPQATSPAPIPEREEAAITVPAGTRLALVLTHPIDSKSTRRGDQIFAQMTDPVTVENQVAIPAGTFVQGQVEKLTRRGSRGEMLLQSVAIVFPSGYVSNLNVPMNMESDEGTAWNNPSTTAKTSALVAPMAGAGAGLAIGSAVHTTQSSTLGGTTITSSTPKGMAIGSIVGAAAGGAVALVLLARSHHFYVDAGSAAELTLTQPMTLSRAQIAEALRSVATQPAPAQVTPKTQTVTQIPASTDHGTCYTPGTPGTPDTVIPGTPPMGSSPGTPTTVIPGTPPTPPIPYPCP